MLRVRNLSKTYGATVALDGIDLEIASGQYAVLLGPSGSGKTTLLSILGGFSEADSGQVTLAGRDIGNLAPAQRPTTTVFQDYALFPHMSVGKNVGFGLFMRGVARREREIKVERALDMVGLGGFARRRIHQLSGGQRQRVALARALIVEPSLLLLDEPLGALDLGLRRQMQEELKHLQQRLGTTFIHVTHDQDEAMALADLLIVMNAGRIEDSGPAERVYLRPKSRFSATFMGDSNLLSGEVVARNGHLVDIKTALGVFSVSGHAAKGAQVGISIRPEQISLNAPCDHSVTLGAAVLGEQVFHGAHIRCHAKPKASDDIDLLLHQAPSQALPEGREVTLYARSADLVLLTD